MRDDDVVVDDDDDLNRSKVLIFLVDIVDSLDIDATELDVDTDTGVDVEEDTDVAGLDPNLVRRLSRSASHFLRLSSALRRLTSS